MRKIQIIFTVLFILLVFSGVYSGDKLAITIKARGETYLKRAAEEAFKSDLKVGTSLFQQDHIKTGKDGYTMVVFLDDKSQLKIRENSELVVAGERTEEAISKQVTMNYGKLKAEISEQRKGDFVVATPTSVASVKGTVFWIVSDPVAGDVFYGMEGMIEVTNNESGEVIVVGANQTGTSTPQGNVGVQDTQEGETPVDEEEEEETPTNTLRIQLQNEQGEIKELEIEYK